jgi:DNA-directed RNA polymerase subunit omega
MTQIVMPKDVDSKFRFIVVAAQRSKQIQQGAKARVDVKTRKPTRVAMQEVLHNAVSWEIVDPEAPAPVAEETGQEG